MPITELFTGTENVGATEWSLATDSAGPSSQTTPGLVQAVIDVDDIADGEQLRLRAYEKVRSGDTQRKIWEFDMRHQQVERMIYTPPMILMHGWDFTLEALSGTITCHWSVRSLASTVTERVTGSENVVNTEWSMATDTSYDTGDAQTTDGFYQVFIDVNDETHNEVLQVSAYEKARSGDTQRLAYRAFYYGVQMCPILVTPTLCGIHGWDWTLRALSGTITCLWSIRTVGS